MTEIANKKDNADKKDKKNRKPLTAEFYALAKQIEDGAKVSEGVIEELTPGAVYEKNLPAGQTMAGVNELKEYDTVFVAASLHACGNLGVKAMMGPEGKNLNQCQGTIKMSEYDHAEFIVHRSAERLDPIHKTKIQKPGHVDFKYVVKARDKTSTLKHSRSEIAALAMELLVDK